MFEPLIAAFILFAKAIANAVIVGSAAGAVMLVVAAKSLSGERTVIDRVESIFISFLFTVAIVTLIASIFFRLCI